MNISDLKRNDYLKFSEIVKEKMGNYEGKVAIIGVGYGGEEFFRKRLEEPFQEIGMDFHYHQIHQADTATYTGLRPSAIFSEINPSTEKAILVERTARSGDSLMSANLCLLREIYNKKLNLDDIYSLVAEDFADLGHFQLMGTNNYGKTGGRTIFKRKLKEMFPDQYGELESWERKDIFLKISNIPHVRFDKDYMVSEDRKLATKAAMYILMTGPNEKEERKNNEQQKR